LIRFCFQKQESQRQKASKTKKKAEGERKESGFGIVTVGGIKGRNRNLEIR